MRAEYDSQANAIAITLAANAQADVGDPVHERAVVATTAGVPIDVEVLYPDQGIEEPLAAAAERYGLDLEALLAAARSALAAPDRQVELVVSTRR